MSRKVFISILGLLLIFSFWTYGQTEKMNASSESDTPKNNLLIPNAFTPNNDGINDYFKILHLTNEQIQDFIVFNRWGTIVYKGENPLSGWDGKYKSKPQPEGIYGYLIRIAFPNGEMQTFKGTVTLIR